MSIRFDGLGINLGYVPKSIQIMGWEISILGILLSIGMLLGILFIVLEAKRRNQDQDVFLGAILMAGIGAILGGRVFYAGFNWNLFKSNPITVLNLRNGGMVLYGALFGGILFVFLYCSLRKISFGEVADTMIFGVLLVQIFTRLGDFFNRESFGTYTESVVAMRLPLASVRSGEVLSAVRENLLTIDGVSWIQVHPAFLYEMLWCIVIFLVLLVLRRKKKFSGEIYMRYMAAYGFERFFVEWIRTDQLWIPSTTLPINMIISAVLFLFFSLAIRVSGSMAKKRTEAANRRKKELEEVKAAEEAAKAEEEGPVDIEAILKEEERLQEQERQEEERAKAEQQALEDAERVLEELETEKKEPATFSEMTETIIRPEVEIDTETIEAAIIEETVQKIASEEADAEKALEPAEEVPEKA